MLLVPGWFRGIQAFVCLSLIASIGTLLLAILYTFVHSVSKRLVQMLFIVAAALAAMFMLGGFAWFAAKAKDHFVLPRRGCLRPPCCRRYSRRPADEQIHCLKDER
ncbi:hypothetical protein LSAT2_002182 [Lamellibrachia satsuma]|nr:hypothetical protein LSAT2_002182 [Lamellibrachia satsuma]